MISSFPALTADEAAALAGAPKAIPTAIAEDISGNVNSTHVMGRATSRGTTCCAAT